MNQNRLLDELDKVAARYRSLRLWQGLAAAWLAAGLAVLLLWGGRYGVGGTFHLAWPVLLTVALIMVGACVWLIKSSDRSYLWLARRVESAFPDLRTCLLAAVELRPDLPDGRFGYLQSTVLRQALDHARRNPWSEAVPPRAVLASMAACLLSFVFFVTTVAAVSLSPPPPSLATNSGSARSPASASEFTFIVEPGDTEVERGSSLLVLARVEGPLPPDSTLVYRAAGGEEVRLSMPPSLDDPVFAVRIPAIDTETTYFVELGGKTSPTYRVKAFEYPKLERADARLVFPAYTGLEERLVQDVRTVSVIEGTDVTLICRLNKQVARALLEEKDAAPIVLTAAPGNSTEPAPTNAATDAKESSPTDSATTQPIWQTTIRAEKTRRLTLRLTDDAGRENVVSYTFTLNVQPNRAPTLKPLFPARDVEVSALEELDVKASVWDDVGVARYGIVYSLAGKPEIEVVSGDSGAARKTIEFHRLLSLEELRAEPDQLLSYYFWAEDFGADGQIRRTSSDMYFAEVRPWDEIYRQGQQPPGGESQQQGGQQQQGGGANAQAAQELAQLQKDIINATWKIIRREITDKLTDAFASDVGEIQLSQTTAIEQATSLTERLQDQQSLDHAAAVIESMQQAAARLTAAQDGPTREPLTSALAAEQAAYQGLLKLRAREHEVVRQQQRQQQQSSSQSNNSSSRSQQQRQQMQQLDLNDEQNRYETQRLAQSQPDQQQERETRQVLNRLRELARRQHDLNERLNELQSALDEAKNEQQREEIRRQLKRLQDEQRQILQDTDELKSRMDAPENQERMADSREQLEQTREQVRRAAEALEQQQVSQAAASGARAERQLDDLRDEFRRQTSNQFSEQVRELRDAAQQLDEREQQIAQQLRGDDQADETNRQTSANTKGNSAKNPANDATKNDAKSANDKAGKSTSKNADKKSADDPPGEATKSKGSPPKARSLRDDDQRDQLAEELKNQRQRFSELQERMRQTIQDAEQTEPLLSERLYDVARNAQDANVGRALDAAEQSLRGGFAEDANKLEELAGRGIRQLREGVDRAAEAVLGDETESLRRARDELDDLAQQLQDEIQRNSPENQDPASREQTGQQPRNRQSGNRTQTGQQQDGQQQSQQQAGQQQGQQQGGQQQGGQQQGQQQGRQQGQQQRNQQQGGQQQVGQQQSGQQQSGQQQSGQQPGDSPEGKPGSRGQRNRTGSQDGRPAEGAFGGVPTGGGFAPLTGEDFRDWSDRLRDVEEMVSDPELRAEAARIRERARAMRADIKRQSAPPNWDLVQVQVAGPLVELQQRVADEVLRRSSRQALVPLDRDPVPPKYSEKTRRYYERLGSGAARGDDR